MENDLSRFANDPLGFVMYAYPWGEADTVLEKYDQPQDWQIKTLEHIGESYKNGDSISGVLRIAVSAGHGSGCTAFPAWIIHWFVSVFPESQAMVTASIKQQLITALWIELRKWYCISKHKNMLEWTETSIFKKEDEYACSAHAIPQNKDNPELFAGAVCRNVLAVFYVPIGINDVVWDTVEGSLSGAENAVFLAIGMLNTNKGKFADCFKEDSGWWTLNVDSRSTDLVSKEVTNGWVEDHGEDSDFVRVRVRGLAPLNGVGRPQAADSQMSTYTCWDYEYEEDFEKEEIKAESMIAARNKYAWMMIGYIGEQHTYELAIAVEHDGVVKKWEVRVEAKMEFTFNREGGASIEVIKPLGKGSM